MGGRGYSVCGYGVVMKMGKLIEKLNIAVYDADESLKYNAYAKLKEIFKFYGFKVFSIRDIIYHDLDDDTKIFVAVKMVKITSFGSTESIEFEESNICVSHQEKQYFLQTLEELKISDKNISYKMFYVPYSC